MNNVDLSLGVTGVNTGVQQNNVAQAANTNVGVVTQPNNNVNQQIVNTQAVFTQEQVNNIISGRVNTLNQKIQELNNQLAQAQQLNVSYQTELNSFKQKSAAKSAGVPDAFVDFVVFEANKLAVNGKSFDDAIKEYVAANGSLFGVSNQNIQGQEMTIPSAPAPTQVAANPAQNIQGQQVVPNTTTQNVVQPMNLQQNSNITTPQFNTTNVAGASSIGNTNNIDSQVNDFLKQRGLIK